nr:MAG TPA: hypothetical protein [Caudoviricetes sp.]
MNHNEESSLFSDRVVTPTPFIMNCLRISHKRRLYHSTTHWCGIYSAL